VNRATFDQVFNIVQQWPASEREKLIRALSRESRERNGPVVDQPGRIAPPPVMSKDRSRENQWLAEHHREYIGQWVALEGDRLIAHGEDAAEVFDAADASGIERPMVIYVEDPDAPPFAGW
jgi:Family of unknown function (DUF5678)